MVDVSALGTRIKGHVLDNSEHRDLELAEHVEALPGVDQGHVLGGGDDDRAGHRHVLAEGQGHVTGPRGQVDDHIVELPPEHVADELFERFLQERTPPDDGLVRVD